jgi:hypothetical protein
LKDAFNFKLKLKASCLRLTNRKMTRMTNYDLEEGRGDDEEDVEISNLMWIRLFVSIAGCAYVIISVCLTAVFG